MEILGTVSALLVLCAFIANQYGFVRNDNIWYDTVNLLAAAGLCWYAYTIQGWPFVITNAVWMLISGIDVVRYLLGARPHKLHKPRLN